MLVRGAHRSVYKVTCPWSKMGSQVQVHIASLYLCICASSTTHQFITCTCIMWRLFCNVIFLGIKGNFIIANFGIPDSAWFSWYINYIDNGNYFASNWCIGALGIDNMWGSWIVFFFPTCTWKDSVENGWNQGQTYYTWHHNLQYRNSQGCNCPKSKCNLLAKNGDKCLAMQFMTKI